MIKRLKFSLCVCASAVFLAACGGGSGDGDGGDDSLVAPVVPLNVVEVPDVSAPEPDTLVPDTSVAPVIPVTQAPAPNPFVPEPVVPEPVAPEPAPVDLAPNDGASELATMFGVTDFTHRFQPNGTITFLYRVDFSAEGLSSADDGIFTLTGEGDGFSVPDGTTDLGSANRMVLTCAAGGSGDILCIRFFSSGSRDYFRFPTLNEGTSTGTYLFCLEEMSDSCITILFDDPSGSVVVENIAPQFASLDTGDRAAAISSGDDSLSYKLYENQASPSSANSVQSRQNDDSAEDKARLDALKALNSKIMDSRL